MTPFETYFIVVSTFVWAIIIHEFGHWAYFRFVLEKNVEMRFQFRSIKEVSFKTGYPIDYKDLSKREKYHVYLSGVAFGTFPILVAGTITLWAYLLIPAYLWGCKGDFKKMIHQFKKVP